jgi:hypothetical protein
MQKLTKQTSDPGGAMSDSLQGKIQQLLETSARGEIRGVIVCWEDSAGYSHNSIEGRGDSLAFLANGIVETIAETLMGGDPPPPQQSQH